jgi:hypothetical protein
MPCIKPIGAWLARTTQRSQSKPLEGAGPDLPVASACVATGHNVDSTLTDMLDGSTGVTWADVVKGGLRKDSGQERRPTKNVVLRYHSLETIQ